MPYHPPKKKKKNQVKSIYNKKKNNRKTHMIIEIFELYITRLRRLTIPQISPPITPRLVYKKEKNSRTDFTGKKKKNILKKYTL